MTTKKEMLKDLNTLINISPDFQSNIDCTVDLMDFIKLGNKYNFAVSVNFDYWNYEDYNLTYEDYELIKINQEMGSKNE